MMTRSKRIFAFVLLAIAVAVVAYTIIFKSRGDVVNSSPDYSVSAKELIHAFETDTTSASKKYANKVLAVQGTVRRVDTTGAVVLGEESSPSEVVLALDQTYHLNDYRNLRVGEPAQLQGVFSGYQQSGNDPDDLLSGLGTTVQLRSAGVKK